MLVPPTVPTERDRRSRPLVVCNRAPYEPAANGGFKRGSGGVVTALTSLAKRLDANWVACLRTSAERGSVERDGSEFVARTPGGLIHYAVPTAEERRLHYSVISNPVLWYTQHYLWDLSREPMFNGDVRGAWRNGYVAVNRRMANAAARVAEGNPSPTVLIHDYQLYLVPQMLRQLMPAARLQHFTHIPWPMPTLSSGSTERTRRRTSCGASSPTRRCSPIIRSCTAASSSGPSCSLRGRRYAATAA
jgi:trehalose 6-phosphate synthase